jgi:hypothetical protein
MNKAVQIALEKYKYYKNQVDRHDYLVAVDFSLPSSQKRLFVYDLKKGKVVRRHHVAHGSKSSCRNDSAKACYFSNKVGSRKSSLGAMKTGKTYTWGKRFPTAEKLKMHGLEKGINSNVFVRAIVIHSSNYVTDSYIAQNGRAGCSWGCFAIDPAIADSLIRLVKDGCFLYAHT